MSTARRRIARVRLGQDTTAQVASPTIPATPLIIAREAVHIVHQIKPQMTATLTYDGAMVADDPGRHDMQLELEEFDLDGSALAAFHTLVLEWDYQDTRVLFTVTSSFDCHADLRGWLSDDHIKNSLAIAVKQAIEFQQLSRQGSQRSSDAATQLSGGPRDLSRSSFGGSGTTSPIFSSLGTVVQTIRDMNK